MRIESDTWEISTTVHTFSLPIDLINWYWECVDGGTYLLDIGFISHERKNLVISYGEERETRIKISKS